jgi:hypothetical protein
VFRATVEACWPDPETLMSYHIIYAHTEAANIRIKHLKRTGSGYRNSRMPLGHDCGAPCSCVEFANHPRWRQSRLRAPVVVATHTVCLDSEVGSNNPDCHSFRSYQSMVGYWMPTWITQKHATAGRDFEPAREQDIGKREEDRGEAQNQKTSDQANNDPRWR